jgi:hypothetical protein
VAADHHSAHRNIAGIPWWGAVLTAVIASLVGFAFDAGTGGQQLTAVFSTLYVVGCLVAVLAVQQAGLFTAVIQPPLVLFVVVPVTYFLMHSSQIQGVKDILINCGYPLIERFPLMFLTSAAVLLIGLARWYFGKSTGDPAVGPEGRTPSARKAWVSAKLSSLVAGAKRPKAADTAAAAPRQRRAADRRRTGAAKAATARTDRKPRPDRAGARSRHARPSESEIADPMAERPRRRRPRPGEDASNSSVEPRRRPRPSRDARDARDPREPRDPRGRRIPYDRDDPYERRRPARSERRERPQRRRRADDYTPFDTPSDSPRDSPRDARFGDPFDLYGSRDTSTHHPISRVRYRGDSDGNGNGNGNGEPGYRPRRRPQRDADRWEYDI